MSRAAAVSGAILLAAVLALLPVAAKFALTRGLAWRCPAMTVLHIPCPSCGSTRAFAALSRGELLAAVRFNPLITLSFFGAFLMPLRSVRTGLAKLGWGGLLAAVLLNWIYLLCWLPEQQLH